MSRGVAPDVRARLPINMDTVNAVAEKYGLDVSNMNISFAKASRSFYGATGPDGTTVLARPAFSSEEQLVRTLAHEQYHVWQLEGGMKYPAFYDPNSSWEVAAAEYEDQYWAWASWQVNGG